MNIQPEEWRVIVGYEGLYEVSDLGRVRAVSKISAQGRPLAERIMRTSESRGYLAMNLTKDKIEKRYTVHRLVAGAFIGPRPINHDINHKNGIKSDNRCENLEYVTKSENQKHSFRIGLHCNKGIRHSQHKINEAQAMEIYQMAHSEQMTHAEIGSLFGLCSASVCSIKNGRLWNHVTRHGDNK